MKCNSVQSIFERRLSMARGPFEGPRPDEVVTGDDASNTKKRRHFGFTLSNGESEVLRTEEDISFLDQNATAVDERSEYITLDSDGVSPPINPGDFVGRTRNGRYITSPEQAGSCTSFLHRGESRLFKIGYEGRKTENGAICNECIATRNSLVAALLILIGGLFVGVIVGLINGIDRF